MSLSIKQYFPCYWYMDYIKLQKNNIAKIAAGHQGWYKADSEVWGERYVKEKKDVLTKKRTLKELAIITKYLPKHCRKILDAPCGYGRITNLLSEKKYDVTGIDINKYFVEIAKKDAAKKKVGAKYYVGDILTAKVPGTFDAVLNIFTSIGYLENDKKNEQFIGRLCGKLKPKGRLIIETINPIALLPKFKFSDSVVQNDGTVTRFLRHFDIRTSTSVTEVIQLQNGRKTSSVVHVIRLYYPHEIISICEQFGCSVIAVLDQNGKEGNIINSQRIWLIFQKK